MLCLVGALVYLNGLSGAFVIDDRASIVHNETIRSLTDLDAILATAPDSPVAGRPLVNLTFALNYALGELEPVGYHAVNLLLHLACALLVFELVRRTLALEPNRSGLPASPDDLAFATSLLWVVHPLNSEVVMYLSQRSESLVALAILGALYGTLRAADGDSGGGWAMVAVVSCWLGIFAKELVAVAPILAFGYDRIFLSRGRGGWWRDRKWLHLGLVASWLPLAWRISDGARDLSVGFSLGTSAWGYLLNQAEFLVRYLRLALWPDSLVAFYGWPRDLALVDVWPEALAVVALLLATVLAVAGRAPRLGYLGLWFFVLLAPTSSVVPIVTEVAAERRMYLPLVAVLLLLVVSVAAALRRLGDLTPGEGRRRALVRAGLLLSVAAALGWTTVTRNAEYDSELRLAETLVGRWPTGVAHQIYGLALLREGRAPEGIAQLRAAVSSGNSRAGAALGRALVDAGRLGEAESVLLDFLAMARREADLVHPWLRPDADQRLLARVALAEVHAARERWDRVEQEARAALQLDPDDPRALVLLADAHFARARWHDAIRVYRRHLLLEPENVGAWVNLGVARLAAGEEAEAGQAFARAVEADPDDPDAREYLALFLWQRGNVRAASEHARRAVALGARDPLLMRILGETSSGAGH